ncbi:hypothetical protein ACFCXR_18310 [Streptomyces noursei]|uniref:hypothetical protein n=1 Tax=Streptomyces noursei TaxID=1971 RepID=UPI0035E3686C
MTDRTKSDRKRRRDLADAALGVPPRLLPWSRDGKVCFLSTDGGPRSFVSRLADDVEDVQLEMAGDVQEAAEKVLTDPMSPHAEVRYTAIRLTESLREVLRIAESRGARIPVPDDGDREGDEESPLPAEGRR